MTRVFDVVLSKLQSTSETIRARPHHAARQSDGLYVARLLQNTDELQAWAKANGLALDPNPHTTIVHSSVGVALPHAGRQVVVPPKAFQRIEALGGQRAIVLRFKSPALTARWREARHAGATWSYRGFRPHLTLFYDRAGTFDPKRVKLPTFPLVFGPEVASGVDDDAFDMEGDSAAGYAVDIAKHNPHRDSEGRFTDRLRAMPSTKPVDAPTADGLIALAAAAGDTLPPYIAEALALELAGDAVRKADATKQYVTGWANVIATADDVPVVDGDGDHVPEAEIVKAEARYMARQRRTAGDFHRRLTDAAGKDAGPYRAGETIESYVLTKARRAALGLVGRVPTGWLITQHITDPAVWAKIEKGQYQGFSIGGKAKRVLDPTLPNPDAKPARSSRKTLLDTLRAALAALERSA